MLYSLYLKGIWGRTPAVRECWEETLLFPGADFCTLLLDVTGVWSLSLHSHPAGVYVMLTGNRACCTL